MNEEEVESISKDKAGNELCLCWNTQREILHWIIDNLKEKRIEEMEMDGKTKPFPILLDFNEVLEIERDPFGYVVRIRNKEVIK
jgi:hypothetical protein